MLQAIAEPRPNAQKLACVNAPPKMAIDVDHQASLLAHHAFVPPTIVNFHYNHQNISMQFTTISSISIRRYTL